MTTEELLHTKNRIPLKSILSVLLFAVAGLMYCFSFGDDSNAEIMPIGKAKVTLEEESEGSGQSGGSKAMVMIDINTASAEQLTSLTGIGESKARSIVEFRNANGYFRSIEEIMLVPGIKDGTFQKIKANICVGEEVIHGEEGSDS